jgi:SAM-dependent methyltransferase
MRRDGPVPPAGDSSELLSTEQDLAAVALALGAEPVRHASFAEALARSRAMPRRALGELVERVRAGEDPLGDAFCRLRSPAERRRQGAVYTPGAIVQAMVAWAAAAGEPGRVVDPGTGSGRFLLDAARRFPRAALVGYEVDPLAALVARANLAAVGAAERARIHVGDYCRARLPRIESATLFIGNPPYVRHHGLPRAAKRWLVTRAARAGFKASALAGLHVHFFLATLLKAQPGDYGAFITAAEWLDVNYGSVVRDLLLDALGGHSITLVDPVAEPFPGVAATAAITTFRVGSRPGTWRIRRVGSLGELHALGGGEAIERARLVAERRWSGLTAPRRQAPSGYVELGELFRVHRGQATGANRFWIAGSHSRELPPGVTFPAVTRAHEVIAADGRLADDRHLRRVIDLPADLGTLDPEGRRRVDAFLDDARRARVHEGYLARQRKAWWSVGLRAPAAILATYMARRSPAFALNAAGARHLNVAHGLYPREALDERTLALLVAWLNACTAQADGRTYAGGLTKFEPREMERIRIPPPARLGEAVAACGPRDLKVA